MSALTDSHCHFLPGVDDGAAEEKESLGILRLLRAASATFSSPPQRELNQSGFYATGNKISHDKKINVPSAVRQ